MSLERWPHEDGMSRFRHTMEFVGCGGLALAAWLFLALFWQLGVLFR